MELGTVISTIDGPSPHRFSFVVNEKSGKVPVKKNQFVELNSAQGKVVAMVQNVVKTNRYFERAESVREYERSGTPMNSIFPIDRWEYLVADAQALGVYSGDLLHRSSFPPSPGTKVNEIENSTLKKFLGLSDDGLEIGLVEHHDLPVRLDITRLVQKHCSCLGQSGVGKSYFMSVAMEELLDRKPENGRVAILVIDAHGEYTGFAKTKEYAKQVKVIKGQEIRIGVSNLSGWDFRRIITDLSSPQSRYLQEVISDLKKKFKGEGKQFNLDDIIKFVESDDTVNENVGAALINRMKDLKHHRLFNYSDYPSSKELKAGNALILDLSDITNVRKKQMIVYYLSNKLFYLRKRGLVPPYLEIIEEAHQFAPSGEKAEDSISLPILRTIAREGRKFYASLFLVSQRPIRLNTTVLSQCNTQIILRVTNPYDLKHIGESSEGITSETLGTISSLRTGEGLIVGEAVNFPLFVSIRKRRSADPDERMKLQDYAIKYEEKMSQHSKDAETFM